MCDRSKRKSSRYCRTRNKLRTVNTTKWELPIPGSKPYWDKICGDLEKRKEHVSDSSYPPSPSPDEITDPMKLKNDENVLNKPNNIVEPIVKIFPPTPMRMSGENRELKVVINEYDVNCENTNNDLTNSFSNNIFNPSIHLVEAKKIMRDNNVGTKKTCQIHKNTPALKIFDDDLKKFLPNKKLTKILFNDTVLESSKLREKNYCSSRGRETLKYRRDFDKKIIKNKHQCQHSFKSFQTVNSDDKKLKNISESFHVDIDTKFKYPKLNEKSKSRIIKSNLNYMLNIPKLNDVYVDGNYFKLNDEMIVSDKMDNDAAESFFTQQKLESISDVSNSEINFSRDLEFQVSITEEEFKKMRNSVNEDSVTSKLTNNDKSLSSNRSIKLPRLSDELPKDLNSTSNSNVTSKLCLIPEKDFLKVPKLGNISCYSSFSKLTPRDSIEAEEILKSFDQDSSKEIEMGKRDFLKVPKLGMMSSYASFNSLKQESFDSDGNSAGYFEKIFKDEFDEASSKISVSSNLNSTRDTSFSEDKPETLNLNENIKVSMPRDEDINPNENKSSQNVGKQKRRQSLKDSVKYAYRALKFLTSNKNLDFQPRSYNPLEKYDSSSGSSKSSRISKYSKFVPAIKPLTYDDVNKNRSAIRSVSSTSYGTIRSRLRQSASQYLGSDYVFFSSKSRAETPSTTIPSSTRSTSGPTLNFQYPLLNEPSKIILNNLPEMSIFPRKKYDKCFACLHKIFQEPVKSRRELPLATWNAVTNESTPLISESESSSISLPDVRKFSDYQSRCDENWTEILKMTKKSSLLDKAEWKSSKGSLRTNVDSFKSRPTLVRGSEENQTFRNDAKTENTRRNNSPNDLNTTNALPKPVSLSSEHSKASSLSGHSTESEEPKVEIKKSEPTSECFESPMAPQYWVPNLEPLKALKFRKPISMHGRAASVTKTEDDSGSDDNSNNYRTTMKDGKTVNVSTRKMNEKNEERASIDSSSKSATKFGEKSNLVKQPSVIAKIVATQLSTLTSLGKKQSRVDLLSGDSKIEAIPDNTNENVAKKILKEPQKSEASQSFEKLIIFENFEDEIIDSDDKNIPTDEIFESIDPSVSDKKELEYQSMDKSSLTEINEQLIENENSFSTDENKSQEKLEKESVFEDFQPNKKSRDEIYSSESVVEILEKCIEDNLTPYEMLKALNNEAINEYPFTCKEIKTNNEIARSSDIAKNLIKLLIDSKKYLNPDIFSPNLEFSSPQIPLCNPRQLRRVLPQETYKLVARILGMPENPVNKTIHHKSDQKYGYQSKDAFKLIKSYKKYPSTDSYDMIVHPPSPRDKNKKSIINSDDFEYPQLSPYALFMDKPRRKAINWRPLTERDMLGYDPEATLNMRATRVTNKICEEFCEWLRGLGGGHGDDIDEEVLKDMFQIEFTAEACRAMQVLIREIPMVPTAVAISRNTPGAGELALTRRHLIRDAKAEKMKKKLIGFGSALPQSDRFIPPKNCVNEKWLQCEKVPRDLETMEAVWKGITHLDSVKGFLAWVKTHPGIKLPKVLTEAYTKKENLVRQPSFEETGGHLELEIDQIECLKVGDVE